LYGKKSVMFFPDTLKVFYLLLSCCTFALNKIQPIISNCARAASNTTCPLSASTCLICYRQHLQSTITIQTAKPEITISQQLLGRFRSSFQGMKPYPTLTRLSFTTAPILIFLVIKFTTFFHKLPLTQFTKPKF
jgi:hypothetical protein